MMGYLGTPDNAQPMTIPNPRMKPGKTKQAAVARWLEERDWIFTEMTEAQKLEMRRAWSICGAATANSGYKAPCVFWAYPENGRCKTHGGASLKGIASPSYQGKGRSRYMPEPWLPIYQESREDPELLNMGQDLGLLELRIKQLFQKMGTGSAEAEAWDELREVVEQRTRIIERHTKQQVAIRALVAVEDAMTDYQALAMAVKTTIENTDLKRTKAEDLIRAIATQFARIVAVEYLADAGTGDGGPGDDLAGGRARKALPGPRRLR